MTHAQPDQAAQARAQQKDGQHQGERIRRSSDQERKSARPRDLRGEDDAPGGGEEHGQNPVIPCVGLRGRTSALRRPSACPFVVLWILLARRVTPRAKAPGHHGHEQVGRRRRERRRPGPEAGQENETGEQHPRERPERVRSVEAAETRQEPGSSRKGADQDRKGRAHENGRGDEESGRGREPGRPAHQPPRVDGSERPHERGETGKDEKPEDGPTAHSELEQRERAEGSTHSVGVAGGQPGAEAEPGQKRADHERNRLE